RLQETCERARNDQRSFCEIERDIMGVDHQQLGQALAELWKFPRSCQLVAGYHHRPGELADSNRALIVLVHVADTICCQDGRGFNLTALHQPLDSRGLEIDAEVIER